MLGVGPGNWPVHYPRYMSPGDPSFDADDMIPTNPWPSSDWMALLAERGLPAFVLLILRARPSRWAPGPGSAETATAARARRSHYRRYPARTLGGRSLRRRARAPGSGLLRLDHHRCAGLHGAAHP